MVKHENGWHHDTHHVWRRWKFLITFHVQCLRMILSEMEACGVQICRRILLKYEVTKWIKMGVKWELWIKMANFLLEWQSVCLHAQFSQITAIVLLNQTTAIIWVYMPVRKLDYWAGACHTPVR